MKKLFFLLIMSIPLLLVAQRQKAGNLTIFSEDGDKFFLVLNGEKQNNIAQTNLRIEELPQPYYNAKIIFADSSIVPISKNNLLIANQEGTMMDVTYKIRKDKTRKAKLNYYSAIAVQQNYIPPAGVSVYHYGQPALLQVRTTTTTTNDVVSANVSVSNINMSVVVDEPYVESRTTTTHNSSPNSNKNSNSDSKCNGWPMNQSDFAAALKTIGNSSFEDTKLSSAKSISSKNCLSSDQVVKICNLFSFEESKLVFAKHAYNRTTDQKNYFKVEDVFSFDSSKEALSKFTSKDDY